jgi:hypothetical protein
VSFYENLSVKRTNPTSLFLQVNADTFLVSVDGKKVATLLGLAGSQKWGTPISGVVTTHGVLDLDNFGSKVTQDHGAIGSGQDPSQVQNPDMRQRTPRNF